MRINRFWENCIRLLHQHHFYFKLSREPEIKFKIGHENSDHPKHKYDNEK